MRKNPGFTLVEILAVIVIISILAGIATAAYTAVQKDARDNDRKSDVLILKAALERYFEDNGSYPIFAACQSSFNGCDVGTLSTALVPNYIDSIPTVPNGTNYKYIHPTGPPATTNAYELYVVRESDVDCVSGKDPSNWWWATTAACGY